MDRVGEVEQRVKGFASEALLCPSQYLLLTDARQLTLDGGSEPLLDTSQPVRAVDAAALSDTGTIDFLGPQPSLPLALESVHPLVDGKPAVECTKNKAGRSRGWRVVAECAHDNAERVPQPCLCGGLNCESSKESNGRTRAKRVSHGSARKGVKVGFSAFGDAAMLVLVATLPAILRPWCVGKRQRLFRIAAHELARRLVEKLGAVGVVYQKGAFHPVGEDGVTYHPHENVLIAGAVLRYGKARRFSVFVPKEWLGAEGWLTLEWRALLVEVFGQWWREGEQPPTVNVFVEYRSTPEEKAHAIRYNFRTFPRWQKHPAFTMRPKSLGLTHGKHKADLLSLVSQLTPGGLEAVKNPPCRHCGKGHGSYCSSGSTAERALQAIQRLLAEVRGEPLSYVQEWRIMTPAACVQGQAPPGLEPPRLHAVRDAAESSLPASSLH